MNKFIIKISVIFLTLITICSCSRDSEHSHDHHHHEEEHAEEKGSHGGRLLTDGDFTLELQIFETEVPPQFRIYAYKDGKQLKADQFSVTVELSRLGMAKELFTFSSFGDFLSSQQEVKEPHSFDVNVKAEFNGKKYSWTYSSYEGRTSITDKMAELSGIKTEFPLKRTISSAAKIRGKITPSEHRIAHIIPRFSGVVRESKKHIGDMVQKGEVLAVIESNESLQPFEVRSQISGTIINGHVIIGEFVPENQWIYVVADLSEVWADFFIPLREGLSVKEGQKLLMSAVNGNISVASSVSYIAPYADEKSQSQLVRAVIPNSDNKLLPGMFVTADLSVSEKSADLAIKKSALQKFRDWDVVFRKVEETYEAAPLELGVSDGEWIEVISGLSSEDQYVSENAFLVKADILKSGAAHDH